VEEKIPFTKICRNVENVIMHSGIQEKEVDLCARELFYNLTRFLQDPKQELLLKKYEMKF
jgi:hypothetical protein